MKFEIKQQFTDKVLFSCEADSFKETLEKAVKDGVELYGADLYGQNLYLAKLRDAKLSGADFRGSNLSGSVLSGADLSGAKFHGSSLIAADLRGAKVHGARFHDTDLRLANLIDVDFSDVSLNGLDLNGLDLGGAYIKDGIKILSGYSVLSFTGNGSEYKTITAFNCDEGIYIKIGCPLTGCFLGTLNEFREKTLVDTDGDKACKKAMQYLGFVNIAAISFDKPEEVQK